MKKKDEQQVAGDAEAGGAGPSKVRQHAAPFCLTGPEAAAFQHLFQHHPIEASMHWIVQPGQVISKLPRKKYFRSRAHSNPLNDSVMTDVPTNPDCMDW